MSEDIQPLTEQPATQGTVWRAYKKAKEAWEETFGSGYPDEKQAYLQKWGPIAEQQEEQMTDKETASPIPLPDPHIHGPFTFLLNQNHNALRGCTTCGAAWVGRMDDSVKVLCWHPIHELDEEEEEE